MGELKQCFKKVKEYYELQETLIRHIKGNLWVYCSDFIIREES